MSAMTREDRDELTKALGRFNSKADALLDGDLRNGSGNQNINGLTISAGGVGVWIATTACLVMLAMMLLGALWVSREFSRMDSRAAEQEVKIDRANTFLSAIWAQAPELEAKIKKDQKSAE